jgi:hypothetical protein
LAVPKIGQRALKAFVYLAFWNIPAPVFYLEIDCLSILQTVVVQGANKSFSNLIQGRGIVNLKNAYGIEIFFLFLAVQEKE